MLGVGVGIAEPPVRTVYQSTLAPAAIPPAVRGAKVAPSQNVCAVVVGGAGRAFTITSIGERGLLQPLLVVCSA